MGIFDWLLTESSQPDGGFLTRLLDPRTASDAPNPAPGAGNLSKAYGPSPLGNSPLLDLLRGAAARTAAANGHIFLGPTDAAGKVGNASALPQRLCRGCANAATNPGPAAPTGDAKPADSDPTASEGADAPDVGAPASLPIKVASPEEAARLPNGTWYEAPDGRVRQRRLPGTRA